ncbi:hypothetical protein ACJIZ3_017379 [Penstemon smallii]|uniref:peroxidase n=1 Tax=Penstemon smallii TaxID=265156 RepID=A0ABD3SWN7_9LAMI
MSSASTAMLALVLVFGAFLSAQCHPLEVGFYRGKCRSADVEAVVSGVIKEWYKKDPTITAALLRMQFHDCFVNSGGEGGKYIVETGRRDGRVSLAKNVDLPSPSISVSNSIKAFSNKGLNLTDMVYLLVKRRGVLQIDQDLALDPLSINTVAAIANGLDFSTRFGQAMIKLGGVQVLTGKQGEIRRSCRATNKRS